MSLSAGSDPWQLPGHTHTDDRITFGCPGCIHLAERARVANAPKRLVVWHCRYLAGPDDVRTLTVARKVRVPDGWNGDQVDQEYLAEVGEAFVMALPDDVPIEYTAAQALVEVACPDCGVLRGMVLPTVCNCTQDGLPYCGRPECDIDWCWYCGDEYTDPCPRHEGVDHV